MSTVMNSVVLLTVLAKTYQFLWADVAAVVSSPSGVPQHLSLAVRSDQTHLSLYPATPYWEDLSRPSASHICRQEKCVVLNAIYGVPLDSSTVVLLYCINTYEPVAPPVNTSSAYDKPYPPPHDPMRFAIFVNRTLSESLV